MTNSKEVLKVSPIIHRVIVPSYIQILHVPIMTTGLFVQVGRSNINSFCSKLRLETNSIKITQYNSIFLDYQ